ncbi:MAG: phosphatase PAP2 family protein [Planctomycetota bacterium]
MIPLALVLPGALSAAPAAVAVVQDDPPPSSAPAAESSAGESPDAESSPDEESTWKKLENMWARVPPKRGKEKDIPWLKGDFNVWSGIATAAIVVAALDRRAGDSPRGGLEDNEGSFETFGDNLFRLLPAAGYVTSLAAGDFKGTGYMLLHNGIASGVMSAGKSTVRQARPGDQNNSSFPSGHSNTAFIGASFLQQRYGARWGVPAYAAAGIVAWSRVHGNKHFVHDVVAGATIAMISAWLFVPPYDREARRRWRDMERWRPWRFESAFTFSNINRNVVQAPENEGDQFESPLDQNADEPWANAPISLEYRFDEQQSVIGLFSPWEIRSFGQFTQDTSFAGQVFPANQELRSAHQLFNFGAQYRRKLYSDDRFQLGAGAGLALQYFDYELFVVNETAPDGRGPGGRVDRTDLYGVVHADVDVGLIWKLYFAGDVDYGFGVNGEYVDWRAFLRLRFNPKWDIGLGWTELANDLRASDIRNDFRRSGVVFNVGYSF